MAFVVVVRDPRRQIAVESNQVEQILEGVAAVVHGRMEPCRLVVACPVAEPVRLVVENVPAIVPGDHKIDESPEIAPDRLRAGRRRDRIGVAVARETLGDASSPQPVGRKAELQFRQSCQGIGQAEAFVSRLLEMCGARVDDHGSRHGSPGSVDSVVSQLLAADSVEVVLRIEIHRFQNAMEAAASGGAPGKREGRRAIRWRLSGVIGWRALVVIMIGTPDQAASRTVIGTESREAGDVAGALQFPGEPPRFEEQSGLRCGRRSGSLVGLAVGFQCDGSPGPLDDFSDLLAPCVLRQLTE